MKCNQSRIWTRVTVSNSCDDNHYTTGTSTRDVLLWTPTHGRPKAGRPARTYIQKLWEDTGCCPEDLPRAMNDGEEWRERVRDIRSTSTTWWWWWWYIIWWALIYSMIIYNYIEHLIHFGILDNKWEVQILTLKEEFYSSYTAPRVDLKMSGGQHACLVSGISSATRFLFSCSWVVSGNSTISADWAEGEGEREREKRREKEREKSERRWILG